MKEKKGNLGKIFKKIIAIFLLIMICISIYIIKSGYDTYKKAIASISIKDKVNSVRSISSYVTLDNIPDTYKKAVVTIEDKRFYEHNGVDIISIGRAIIKDISTLSLIEGGSTITQQVAKNLYLTQEKKFSRKIAEVFIALEMEKELNKEEILELYINVIYYGDGYYGIGHASHGYFGKEPSNLNLYEQTLLVGIPNAPSIYQLSNNSKLTYERQNIVINTLAEAGNITGEQISIIKQEKESINNYWQIYDYKYNIDVNCYQSLLI